MSPAQIGSQLPRNNEVVLLSSADKLKWTPECFYPYEESTWFSRPQARTRDKRGGMGWNDVLTW
jgi:hypothetical protein